MAAPCGERGAGPGSSVTDYRRTEKERWEEDAVADDERPTHVHPLFSAGEPRGAPEASEGEADSALAPELPRGASVESVATFIAQAPSEGRASAVDSPAWSLEAMAAIENDVEEAAEELPLEPEIASPPPLPGRAVEGPLPSMLLGPAISMRGDATERVTTIPKTHPMANSLAPGSSFRSVPPVGSRLSPVARGALTVGLLGLLAGAALLLQSRGEHHALSARHQASATVQPLPTLAPSEETVIVIEESPAPVLLAEGEDSNLATTTSSALPTVEGPSGEPTVAPVLASAARSKPGEGAAERRRPNDGESARATGPAPTQPLRVAVGNVQLRDRSSASSVAKQPERAAVIGAMNAIASELQRCVGEAHGTADVTLTVRSSGAVSHALVEGAFAGSPAGSCIARTLRTAQLPPFGDAVLHIVYPLQL